ncbi:YbaY family lipoprotein [Chryseobacterium sp. c4a]|uniref:YbaY family lipoprotein n=1 Tax=Chryseobacterium sp. c4a TaxID=1573582 RepID=UPI001E2A0665|nr:YbaY family lipoprotein [Chryseobacterium sp. c4a]
MKNHLLLFMAASALTLSSCNKTEKKTAPEASVSEKATENSSDNLKIEFTGTDKFTIKNPKLKVSLYGISEGLQDAPATLITEKEFEGKEIPFTIELPVPKDAESKITPKPTNGVKYYIATEWDSDGNGKANEKGDIFIDHDKAFPNVKLNSEVQKIYVKTLK